MKFQDDISNMKHTYIHTDKPKPICPPLFQSWGHKNQKSTIKPMLQVEFMLFLSENKI